MPSRDDAIAIRRELPTAVGAVLAGSGWRLTDQAAEPEAPMSARIERSLGDDFVGVLRFNEVGVRLRGGRVADYEHASRAGRAGISSSLNPIQFEVEIGASCLGLRRLLALTTSHQPDGVYRPLADFSRVGEDFPSAIGSLLDVRPTAQRIAHVVQHNTSTFLAGHASLELVLDEMQAMSGIRAAETVPAALAVAGRNEEAREALGAFLESGVEGTDGRSYRRFARLLTLWLDGDGTFPDPIPPPGYVEQPATAGFGQVQRHSSEWRSAMAAVAETDQGTAREVRRARLETELAERGLSERPHLTDASLDAMENVQAPFGRTRLALRALAIVASAGLSVVRVARHVAPPAVASRLEPPLRASFPLVLAKEQWTAVSLDGAAGAFLKDVFSAAQMRVANTAIVDIWFDWDASGAQSESQLEVSIGDTRVGVLNPVTSDRYRAIMAMASVRDELPVTAGRLVTRDGGRYVLEVPLPRVG